MCIFGEEKGSGQWIVNGKGGRAMAKPSQESIDEVLEAIWMGRERDDCSRGTVERLCHAPLTQELLDALAEQKLVRIADEAIDLTPAGEERARAVIRRHRLGEALVAHVLRVGDTEIESVGCAFEHAVLPEVEESICTLLGHPTHCPHGAPIPPGTCCREAKHVVDGAAVSVAELRPGDRGKIAYIRASDHERLHRLTAFGISPGTTVEVHQKFPAVVLRFENTELALDSDIADDIFVWPMGPLPRPHRGSLTRVYGDY